MKNDTYILGLSAYYHDSAAVLLKNGEILAAAQEERFSRKKHDARFPKGALAYCLNEAAITLDDLAALAFYDKPFLKFERLLETYYAFAPKGFRSFITAMPVWLKEKLFLKKMILDELLALEKGNVEKEKLFFPEHHLSHAASAFFPSPFSESAILTVDGVGEYATTTLGHGRSNEIEILKEISFPHSLGLLYSAFTYHTGFRVNSGEYKVMGLAPYGEAKYVDKIYEHLLDVKSDGSFRLNMKYFNFATGLTMTSKAFDKLFGHKPRKPETPLTQHEMDMAASIQKVTEEVMLKLAKHAYELTGAKNLVMAGGVALNCVANGRILRESPFENLWIQPAAGDAGGALGAAMALWHILLDNPRESDEKTDKMQGSYLGIAFSDEEIAQRLSRFSAIGEHYESDDALFEQVAEKLEAGRVVGVFQGRMEFGPRALGHRSIIGDARNTNMQKTMNLKIKFRESFRPFAPSVMVEHVNEYFNLDQASPYMLLVDKVQETRCLEQAEDAQTLFGIEKLNLPRSDIPAVTHIDYSARIQTVDKTTSKRYWKLIDAFRRRTGYGVIVNTSFNVRGEPIVATPEDAYRCFMRTNMDYLLVGNWLLAKEAQPEWDEAGDWRDEFELD